MLFEKKVLATLEKCYAVAPLNYKGEKCFLVAAEKKGDCLLFDMNGVIKETIWNGPGGVMTMEQIPGSDGAFLATNRFYSPNDSANASIVIAYPSKNGWTVKSLAVLPFVHRFTILSTSDAQYLVAATLKSAHAFQDDWSCPGRILVAKLPGIEELKTGTNMLQFTPIKSELLKNHGFFKDCSDGMQRAIFGAQNGIYRVTPPQTVHDQWLVEQILAEPTSDMTLIDLDGDGARELVTYSPFHGDRLVIYHQTETGYEKVYTHQEPLEFLHAICGGHLNGVATVLVGFRKGKRQLCAITHDNGYHLTVIDSDVGPANAMILPGKNSNIIISANRETDEVAMYSLRSN